jgi:fluoride exporter
LILGVLVGASLHGDAYLLAGTATVGSYTTFSTWMLETERLGRAGLTLSAAANVTVGLAVGVAALLLGRLLAGG